MAISLRPSKQRPASLTARRVSELRDWSGSSPLEAWEAAWEWILDLREESKHDRDGSGAKLNELFREGVPARNVDGRTEGVLVEPLIRRPVDAGLRALTGNYMPWLGKRFDRAAARGDNLLRNDARWPAKLLWPRYKSESLGDARAAFEFETRVEPGKVDPDREVLVIDYSVVDSNPSFIIKRIRDELVEIVPGANLGKILWRGDDDAHTLIGYFALRSELR